MEITNFCTGSFTREEYHGDFWVVTDFSEFPKGVS